MFGSSSGNNYNDNNISIKNQASAARKRDPSFSNATSTTNATFGDENFEREVFGKYARTTTVNAIEKKSRMLRAGENTQDKIKEDDNIISHNSIDERGEDGGQG